MRSYFKYIKSYNGGHWSQNNKILEIILPCCRKYLNSFVEIYHSSKCVRLLALQCEISSSARPRVFGPKAPIEITTTSIASAM